MKTKFIDADSREILFIIDGYYPVSAKEGIKLNDKYYESYGYVLNLEKLELEVIIYYRSI